MSDKPNLHQSDITTMLMCGYSWYLSRVLGKRKPPVVRMVEGTAVHRAGELNLTSKIETGELLAESDVCDAARDSLNETWDSEGVVLSHDEQAEGEKSVKGHSVDASIRMAKAEHRILAPSIEPVSVERPFRLESPKLDFNIQGTIDTLARTDAGLDLRDRKTARATPPVSRAHNSLQLTLYALAVKSLEGEPPATIHLDTIVDLKRETKLVTHATERTPEDYQMELERMNLVHEAITKGVFLPADPTSWKCSHNYCQHWQDDCPYGRRNRKRMDD